MPARAAAARPAPTVPPVLTPQFFLERRRGEGLRIGYRLHSGWHLQRSRQAEHRGIQQRRECLRTVEHASDATEPVPATTVVCRHDHGAGAFRLLDADHMQSLENNDQGFTHAADVLGVLSCRVAQRPTDWNEVTAEALSAKRLRATLQRSRRDLLYSNRREAINRTPGGK